MGYESFLKDNLIKKVARDHDQISRQLRRADKDLRAAQDLIWGIRASLDGPFQVT
jgi:hypothetical protein